MAVPRPAVQRWSGVQYFLSIFEKDRMPVPSAQRTTISRMGPRSITASTREPGRSNAGYVVNDAAAKTQAITLLDNGTGHSACSVLTVMPSTG